MIGRERVKALAYEMGFDACGITTPELPRQAERTMEKWIEEGKHGEMRYLDDYVKRRERFHGSFPEAKSVIVLGVNYYSKEMAQGGRPTGGVRGRVARYAWGQDYHRVIRQKVDLLKERIGQEAGRLVRFESAVDTQALLERTLAQRAGLGFRGRQTQLLSLQFGPWLFLAELLTDLELEPDEPFTATCGTCRLCVDECPTGAIEEAGGLDARKCIAYLTIEHKSDIPTELRPKIRDWVFGCDQCLTICPYTAKQKDTHWRSLTQEEGFGPELDLLELIEIGSSGQYEKQFGAAAISRANRKQLARNACVALGNSGRQEAIPILERALLDPSAMVRRHAEWAIEQIQNHQSVRDSNG